MYKCFFTIIFLFFTVHAIEKRTDRDINADGCIDTIIINSFAGNGGSEHRLTVIDGKTNNKYETVKIGYPQNFISIIPLYNKWNSEPFFSAFTTVVIDTFCKWFVQRERPDESLLWLLDKYSKPTNDTQQHFNCRWFDTIPDFKMYCVNIARKEYPDLLAYCPNQLCHSFDNNEHTAALFEKADAFIVMYYMHNHMAGLYHGHGLKTDYENKNVVLLHSAHGVILKKDKKYRWLFISDNQGKLRHPSIERVVMDKQNVCIFLKTIYEKSKIFVNITDDTWYRSEILQR